MFFEKIDSLKPYGTNFVLQLYKMSKKAEDFDKICQKRNFALNSNIYFR